MMQTISLPANNFHANATKSKSFVANVLHFIARTKSEEGTLSVRYAGTWELLENCALAAPSKPLVSSFSGPRGGVANLKLTGEVQEDTFPADVMNRYSSFAYGIALSLYERLESPPSINQCSMDQQPLQLVGDPVADVYGLLVRENNAVLALADGVNWGTKPKLAAACAVHSVLQHFNSQAVSLLCSGHAVFELLWRSFLAAHSLILAQNATLTTLSAAFVCQLRRSDRWGVFVVNVGDSPAFAYSPKQRKLVEITVGSHPSLGAGRDMSDSGGVLGPGNGFDPDLSNLTFSYTTVSEGDFVFIVSDGIADNFHPGVVNPLDYMDPDCMTKKPKLIEAPELVAKNILNELAKLNTSTPNFTAQDLCASLMNYSVELTARKRTLLEDCCRNGYSPRHLAVQFPEQYKRLISCQGKLDHASIVAYQVGGQSCRTDF